MGVDLETWRGRIGCFSQRGRKSGFEHAAITLSWPSGAIRVAVIMSLLLLAGDIERNPGPTGRGRGDGNYSQSKLLFGPSQERNESFRRTTRLQSQVAMDATRHVDMENRHQHGTSNDSAAIQEILQKVTNLQYDFVTVTDRLDEIDRKFDREISGLRRENGQLQERVNFLEEKHDNLEAQSRRNNLVFRGIKESKGETWEETEEKVLSFLRDKLELTSSVIEGIEIERAHRLPGKNDRLVIAKFLSYKDKEKVLRTARDKLRGDTDCSVREDYTRRVRDIRTKLFPFMKEAREHGDFASLSYDKLKINGSVYRYDFDADDIVLLRNAKRDGRQRVASSQAGQSDSQTGVRETRNSDQEAGKTNDGR